MTSRGRCGGSQVVSMVALYSDDLVWILQKPTVFLKNCGWKERKWTKRGRVWTIFKKMTSDGRGINCFKITKKRPGMAHLKIDFLFCKKKEPAPPLYTVIAGSRSKLQPRGWTDQICYSGRDVHGFNSGKGVCEVWHIRGLIRLNGSSCY